ncbi:unnamed protein product [Pichia kudriavzevii]
MDEHKESMPLSNVGDLSDRPAGSQENPESSFAEVLQPPITEPTTEIAETSSHVNSALNENMVGNREVNHKEEAPTEKRDSNTDIMDVDEPHNDNLSTTDRMSKELQSSSSSSSSVYKTDEEKENERLAQLDAIQEEIKKMKITQLELVPILLELMQQVNNGEMLVKDVNNACGRIRVRLNRLREQRLQVQAKLKNVETTYGYFHGEDFQNRIQRNISTKENCLLSLIERIQNRNLL